MARGRALTAAGFWREEVHRSALQVGVPEDGFEFGAGGGAGFAGFWRAGFSRVRGEFEVVGECDGHHVADRAEEAAGLGDGSNQFLDGGVGEEAVDFGHGPGAMVLVGGHQPAEFGGEFGARLGLGGARWGRAGPCCAGCVGAGALADGDEVENAAEAAEEGLDAELGEAGEGDMPGVAGHDVGDGDAEGVDDAAHADEEARGLGAEGGGDRGLGWGGLHVLVCA